MFSRKRKEFVPGNSILGEFVEAWQAFQANEEMEEEKKAKTESQPLWVWIARIWLVSLLALLPWKNGSIEWSTQAILFGNVFLIFVFTQCMERFSAKRRNANGFPRMITWLLLIALFAVFQSTIPISSNTSFPSPFTIRIQRWFLGDDVALHSEWFAPAMKFAVNESKELPLANSQLDQSKSVAPSQAVLLQTQRETSLRISMAPDLTLSSCLGLVCAAILIWLGSRLFNDDQGKQMLFSSLAIIGVTVAAHYFIQTTALKVPAWLAPPDVRGVGPFRNKNVGGAFLNCCMAGALAMTAMAFRKKKSGRRRTDPRYQQAAGLFWERYLRDIIQFLSNLNTLQIACLIGCAFLAGGIIATLSRGAALSAFLALLVTLLTFGKKRRIVHSLFVVLALVIASLGLLMSLDATDQVASRFGQLELDENQNEGRRVYVWVASLKAASCYWSTGSGLGTFRYAAIPFIDSSTDKWFAYAESIPAQMLVELGIFGLALLLAISWTLYQLVRQSIQVSLQMKLSLTFGSIFAVYCVYLHNLFDFPVLVPAVYCPTAIMIGVLYSTTSAVGWRSSRRSVKNSRTKRLKSHPVTHRDTVKSLSSGQTIDNTPKKVVHSERSSSRTQPSTDVPSNQSKSNNRWEAIVALAIGIVVVIVASPSLILNWKIESIRLTENYNRTGELLFEPALQQNEIGAKVPSRIPSVARSAELLRIHGISNIQQWKRSRDLKHDSSDAKSTAIDDSLKGDESSVVLRLKLTEAIQKNRDPMRIIGNSQSYSHWNEARLAFLLGQRFCPLDWRLGWGHYVLDWTCSREWQRKYLCRLYAGCHQIPDQLLLVGLLAEDLDDWPLADHCYRSVLGRKPQNTSQICKVLAATRPDGMIDVSIFPRDPQLIEDQVLKVLPQNCFRKRQTIFGCWSSN